MFWDSSVGCSLSKNCVFVKQHSRKITGFTILELAFSITIIGILLTMVFSITETINARAEKSKCMANLRGLYSGAACYVTDQGHWPQIDPTLARDDSKEYANLWITALGPYGLSQQNWICATQHRALGSPDLTRKDGARVDYNATPFDDRPNTAYLWSTQPWFVEHAAVHDGGPLLIYTNGRILTLAEAMRTRSSSQ